MKLLKEFLETFNIDEFPYENVLIHRRKYYLQTKESKEIGKQIPEEAHRYGLFLGESKGTFKASLPLISLIVPLTKKKIVLDKKQSWLFTCKRDIFGEHVNENKNFKFNETIIVTNKEGDALGLATKIKDKHKKNQKEEQHKEIYKNILDLGDYLRREQTQKRR